MSSQEEKQKKLTIVLPEHLASALKAAAAKEGRFMQDIAAEVFEAYLRKKHHYRGRDAPDENPEQKKN
ncbi:hypothetical protein [Paenibacillus validus]|uniref:hypothetical protein n=1 Tax=Paenibacillus validus TaxID=44253 RepID=UPI003D2D542C